MRQFLVTFALFVVCYSYYLLIGKRFLLSWQQDLLLQGAFHAAPTTDNGIYRRHMSRCLFFFVTCML